MTKLNFDGSNTPELVKKAVEIFEQELNQKKWFKGGDAVYDEERKLLSIQMNETANELPPLTVIREDELVDDETIIRKVKERIGLLRIE